MTRTTLTVESALLGAAYAASGPVEIELAGGTIAAIREARGPAPRLLAMPSIADGHNHCRPLSTTSFGAALTPLEQWLPQHAKMPSVDPYTAAAAAFARSLAGGCTSVMMHQTRPMGRTPLPEEARAVAHAAADVGVFVGFAIGMRDRNPLVYGDASALLDRLDPPARAEAEATWLKPMPPAKEQLAQVEAVAEAVADMGDHIDVQYGPNGVQWCSNELLQGVAAASARTGRRVHMHLLETGPQRDWADATYPDGIVGMLDDIGLLSPRLTLAHCVWAREDELRTIARTGARIAVSASSNLHLSSGIAPVPAMLAAGVDVAMGLDNLSFDEDDDALRELRLFHLLNRARGFAAGGLTPSSALRAACATGRACVGAPDGGVLAEGMPADIVLLDLGRLDRDALSIEIDPVDFLLTRGTKGVIVEIYADGRRVFADGRPVGVDSEALHDAVRAEVREGLSIKRGLIAAWPQIEAAIAAHYRGCC